MKSAGPLVASGLFMIAAAQLVAVSVTTSRDASTTTGIGALILAAISIGLLNWGVRRANREDKDGP